MRRRFIVLGIVACERAFAAPAPVTLPSGTYAIDGVATTSSSSVYCPVKKGQSFTGTVGFPGNGKEAFEMTYAGLNANGDISQVRFYAFPPVPSNGLDGWNVGTDVEQFLNGKDISGPGNSGNVMFTLQPAVASSVAFVGGTMTVSIEASGACRQTYSILLQRVGAYFQYK
jgi:hypothetical protein